jgi:hypothetical protein
VKSLHGRAGRLGALAALAVALAACQSTSTPTLAPSSQHVAGATSAATPIAAGQDVWTLLRPDLAGIAASSGNSTCLECDSSIDTTMSGVAAGPAGLVAVGWIYQGLHGVAWHSTDGTRWALDYPFPENTLLTAVAADEHRYVAVGLDGSSAMAWNSVDGVAWFAALPNGAFAAASIHLTAVTHWSGGFAAAGYEGTESGTADAAFWVSRDGITWQRAPDAPGLHDGHAEAIAAGGPGLVAVGTSATASSPGPAVVWTSADGLDWSRVPASPVFENARMRTIAAVPEIGLVAAGEDLAGDSGLVWTSADGTSWTRAPAGADLGGPDSQVRIDAVIGGGPGVVAVGSASVGQEAQYGNGTVWTSVDGLAWQRGPSGVAFDAGEVTAVAQWAHGLVAVGFTGAPDDFTATVWTSPVSWEH